MCGGGADAHMHVGAVLTIIAIHIHADLVAVNVPVAGSPFGRCGYAVTTLIFCQCPGQCSRIGGVLRLPPVNLHAA